MKKLIITFFVCTWSISFGQSFKPGFDLEEVKEAIQMSTKVFYSSQTQEMPNPKNFKMEFESDSMGFDNRWQLWINTNHTAASISLRGTTGNPESWMANFYAAMVPAQGTIKLSKDFVFDYKLANNPNAAVHVGWLISTAYLARDIVPKIDSCYRAGIKQFYINGHSQGGAISYLMTAYLYHLQKDGKLPSDIRFKTYASAAPKPGNTYFAYDYNLFTQDGWAYNTINPLDWVPETFLTVQTASDFNDINIINGLGQQIKDMSFPKKTVAKMIFKSLKKPSAKTREKYEKYFGNKVSKMVKKHLPEFEVPTYYPSGNYVLAGNLYVLKVTEKYMETFKKQELMEHHQPVAYYTLINNLLSN